MSIQNILSIMNEIKLEYCVVDYSKKSGELDIFVRERDLSIFYDVMKKEGFKITHSSTDEYSFIYRLVPDAFWTNEAGEHIHSACQMSCVSLSNLSKFKLPLDNVIQESIWKNKRWDQKEEIWRISNEDKTIFILSRCVFNQKEFDENSIMELNKFSIDWSEEKFLEKMEGVFFKFTSSLVRLIKEQRFDEIVYKHRIFCDY